MSEIMTVLQKIRQHIKNETEKLNRMSAKSKAEYIWDYYKIPICIVLICLVSSILVIYESLNTEEIYLQNAIINLTTEDMEAPEKLSSEFRMAMNLQPEVNVVNRSFLLSFDRMDLYNDAQNAQIIQLMVAAKELDILLMQEKNLENLLSWGIYENLEEVLPPETWEQVKEFAVYMTDPESGISYPAALDVSHSSVIQECDFISDSVVLCVAVNSPHLEHAIHMIQFILSQ